MYRSVYHSPNNYQMAPDTTRSSNLSLQNNKYEQYCDILPDVLHIINHFGVFNLVVNIVIYLIIVCIKFKIIKLLLGKNFIYYYILWQICKKTYNMDKP